MYNNNFSSKEKYVCMFFIIKMNISNKISSSNFVNLDQDKQQTQNDHS